MSMRKRSAQRQQALWIPTAQMPQPPSHPFYQKLNQTLGQHGFDPFVEGLCEKFYHPTLGRPSIPPGVYFRMLMIGYFEGIDSERGIAWRCADSRALSSFLGYGPTESTPDHSSIGKVRERIDLETHEAVFTWVLKVLAGQDLLSGETVGVDATTLEANAAMRSIVRKDSRESYREFLTRLTKASGIQTPTQADLAKLDRKRKNKASNDDWESPSDPDARITKMKDGRTHLAHKAEHAVDMDTQAIVAVTVQPADRGDTESLQETVQAAVANLLEVQADPTTQDTMNEVVMEEVVADKGYHSNETMTQLSAMAIRTYVSEPDRGKRRWKGRAKARGAVYANRRRIRGERGKALMRKRGEVLERSFAHSYETGAMRRTHLRGHTKILKRLLIHGCGFNLGLVMRTVFGVGKPRGLQDMPAAAVSALRAGILATLAALFEFLPPWYRLYRPRRLPRAHNGQPCCA
ncbi:MAG: transposase [Planctomycetota bacterium]|jgi:transposase